MLIICLQFELQSPTPTGRKLSCIASQPAPRYPKTQVNLRCRVYWLTNPTPDAIILPNFAIFKIIENFTIFQQNRHVSLTLTCCYLKSTEVAFSRVRGQANNDR